MHKTFRYRIYPTKAQKTKLDFVLEECRWLYNELLSERKAAWEERQEPTSLYSQHLRVTELKRGRTSLQSIYSQVLQSVSTRLDLAFKAFFRRCRAGDKPGYPRFKGPGRYNSFTFPQAPWGCQLRGGRLHLSKVGAIRIVLHRPIEGTIKACTVQRTPTGKWFASISCEIEAPSFVATEGASTTGVDVGIRSFLVLADGREVGNPHFLRRGCGALAQTERRHSKKRSRDSRMAVARVHEHIRFCREDFSHQLSRALVNEFDIICVEDLNINRMRENSHRVLNREISDVAWNSFINKLTYKAEWAGKKVVKVNPAYTSQDCSGCGYRVEKKLSDRIHKCPACGLELDRDVNAARNILAVGLHDLGLSP